MPEQMIQSQQVTLTGRVWVLEILLKKWELEARTYGVTVTLTPTGVPDATVSVPSDSRQNSRQIPEALLERLCGIVYATRGEQLRLNYVSDKEYADLVRLRHSGNGSIETVLKALTDAQGSVTEQSQQKSRQCKAPLTSADACNDSKDYELFLDTADTKELRAALKLPLAICCSEHGLIFGPPTRNNIDAWKRHVRSHQQNSRQDGEA